MESLFNSKSDLVPCTKMFDNSSTFGDAQALVTNELTLWWSKPNCSVCEINGKQCKLKNNGTEGAVECFREISDPKPVPVNKSILLDDIYQFRPKITDFGLPKLCSKNQSAVSMTVVRGTLGHIAPEVLSRDFGNVSYRSDIYSYGMLLLEMVGGRKNIEMAAEGPFQILYPEWVHDLLDGRDIHVQVEDEKDIEIAKKIATVGLWCIQWHPSDRPSIKTVVKMLEEDGDKLTIPRNPFDSTSSISRD